jgi:polyisoprenyl-phosphate glycosyltransferase
LINTSSPTGRKTVGIVVPVYNEEEALLFFHEQLSDALHNQPYHFLIYYVNDGSSDCTGDLLVEIASQDARVTAIELSKNFGHQAALTAGLDAAQGEYVISLDGDGQHPPHLIASMLELAESGYDLVLTQRSDAMNGSQFKHRTSSLFYQLINRIGDTQVLPGGADFRLISRTALDNLKQMREYHRFLRGMIAWMGFRTVILPYTPPARLAGKTKYTLRKMLRMASNAIFSFSLIPLYIGLSMGAFTLFLAFLEMLYVLSFWITGNQSGLEPGWSSLMFVILVASGIIMILLGFIGVYVGLIFQEVKQRPIYMVRQTLTGSLPVEPTDSRNPVDTL